MVGSNILNDSLFCTISTAWGTARTISVQDFFEHSRVVTEDVLDSLASSHEKAPSLPPPHSKKHHGSHIHLGGD
jgi:hypothetical protein